MCARLRLSVSIRIRSPMNPASIGLACAVRFGIELVVTR
jgi:hypothetical protein